MEGLRPEIGPRTARVIEDGRVFSKPQRMHPEKMDGAPVKRDCVAEGDFRKIVRCAQHKVARVRFPVQVDKSPKKIPSLDCALPF